MSEFHKILIVSASIGAGHNQAAQALCSEIQQSHPRTKVEVADFLTEKNSYLSAIMKTTYLKMLGICPNMYDFLYRWSSEGSHGQKVQNLMAQATKHNMQLLLNRHQPDMLIFTHPFPCSAAAYLKHRGAFSLPLAAVITDFAVHPLWIHKEVNFYFVAGKELETSLLSQHLPATSIFASGIPIAASFAGSPDKNTARKTLNLRMDLPTILVMGGGLGLGPVKDALCELNQLPFRLQLVVVAGHNDSLRKQLQQLASTSKHKVTILGFTNQIHVLMAAADLLITKPGGLTSSEALASNLPLLFLDSLPGQEEENAAYLTDKGAALWIKKLSQLTPAVHSLLQHPELLALMKNRTKELMHPHAATTIVQQLYRCAMVFKKASGI